MTCNTANFQRIEVVCNHDISVLQRFLSKQTLWKKKNTRHKKLKFVSDQDMYFTDLSS